MFENSNVLHQMSINVFIFSHDKVSKGHNFKNLMSVCCLKLYPDSSMTLLHKCNDTAIPM